MGRATQSPYLLTILTGPNAGAQQRLTSRRVMLGASDVADFILDDFEGPDVELTVSKDRIRFKTDRDGLRVIGAEPAEPGLPIYCDLPATVQLTDRIQANICCTHPTRKTGALTRMAAAVGVLAVLGAGGYVAMQSGQFDVISDANAGVNPTEEIAPEELSGELVAARLARFDEAATQEPAAEVATQETTRLTQADAEEMLLKALSDAGLSGLEAKAEGGVLRVKGLLSDARKSDWRAIRDQYDGQFGNIAPLLLEIEEDAEGPPLAIASIWLGDAPEVITRGGDILKTGDTTEGGWLISEITAGAVHLERGRQSIVIDF